MTHLSELAAQLMIGTDRRAPDWPTASGELGQLIEQLANGEDAVEIRALRTAGALAVCSEAGFLPSKTAQAPLPPCQEESRPVLPESELTATLQAVLDDGPDALRAEALRLVANAGRVLPPRLLPRAIGLGMRHAWLRPLLPAVIGERGRWLARLNAGWTAVLLSDSGELDQRWWDEGTLEQRCQFLAILRAQDPADARQRLVATFGETDARGRARLLATCSTGLSDDDEGFLSDCLKDRSKEVRQQAASLLARLPDSQYVARMAERVSASLSQSRKMLMTRLGIEPPETFDPEWKKDGIEEAPSPGDGLGQRAWWLYQMARPLLLTWWNAQLGMDAKDCVRWSKGTDWDLALLRAWLEANERAPAADWSAALLTRLPIKSLHVDAFALCASLPSAEREDAWLDSLESAKRGSSVGEHLARIAQTLSHEGAQLSVPAALRLIASLKKALAEGRLTTDYRLRRTLPEFICCLPPEALPEAATGWPLDRPELQFFADTLAQVLAVIKHRQTLIHRLQEA